ncbi:hypothetical protein M9Y10_037982 [Tritrichomonas musculus]|uniref:Uncharacterized protein n=1 Tax=Tritrichomonas musculus TaxID=1915356 RepID=A0ABR2K7Q1_9EUKA
MDYPNNDIFSGWYATYFFFGATYALLLFIYLFFTRDFCFSNSSLFAKLSYWFFIFALIIKSTGYFMSGGLIIDNNHLMTKYNCSCSNSNECLEKDLYNHFNKNQVIFLFTSALPGYVTSAAYCMIFFSWCSICIEVMEKKSSAFYGKSRCVLLSLLIAIVIGFLITTITSAVSATRNYADIAGIAHFVEAVIAVIRDISVSIAFIVYLRKMWQIFADPWLSIKSLVKSFFNKYFCCCMHSSDNRKQESISLFINYESGYNESNNGSSKNIRQSSISDKSDNNNNSYEAELILMCLSIIISLFIRAASIVIYTVITNTKDQDLKQDPSDLEIVCSAINNTEHSKGYLAVFIVETVFSELLPVIAIIAYRISQPVGLALRETDLGF